MIRNASLKVTRVTHSSVLLDFAGSVVLTDPWFSEKFGYYRGEPLGSTVEDLPALAGVVISHDHYDHNDMNAFSHYHDKGVPIYAQEAAAQTARDAGFVNARTLHAGHKATLGAIEVTAVPALHGVPEVGFVLHAFGLTVYFAGDSLLIPALAKIRDDFPQIDVALLPINGLRVFGKQVVMNPHEAAELCSALKPRVAIPTHYAFTGGWLVDRFFLKYFADRKALPQIFQQAVSQAAKETEVVVLPPGASFTAAPH